MSTLIAFFIHITMLNTVLCTCGFDIQQNYTENMWKPNGIVVNDDHDLNFSYDFLCNFCISSLQNVMLVDDHKKFSFGIIIRY